MVRDFESIYDNNAGLDNLLMQTKVGTNHWSGGYDVSGHNVTTSYTNPYFSSFSGNGIIDGILFNPGDTTNNTITRHLRWRITIDDVVYTNVLLHHTYRLFNLPGTTYNQNNFVSSFFDINARFYRNFKIEVKRVGYTNGFCGFRYLYRTI